MNILQGNFVATSCAFTGHRPHKLPWRYDETDSRFLKLKAMMDGLIANLAQAGVTDYYSGMADGSDLMLSQAVLVLRSTTPALKLHCVLPCDGQADQWPTLSQERYHATLAQANTVSFVSHQYYDGCMLERNRRLVDSAALLLAIYNGERRGGTAATIRYARKLGRGIILIDPNTRSVNFEGSIPDTLCSWSATL